MVDLRTYLDKAERGTAARIARALKVHPVMLSQWASGEKAISEDQAPSLELETGFEVLCETSCPRPKNGRWVRVPDADWPNGKPLLDKTPACASAENTSAPAEDAAPIPKPKAERPEPAASAASEQEHAQSERGESYFANAQAQREPAEQPLSLVERRARDREADELRIQRGIDGDKPSSGGERGGR